MCRPTDRSSSNPSVTMANKKRVRFSDTVRFNDNTCGCLQESEESVSTTSSDRWSACSLPAKDQESLLESQVFDAVQASPSGNPLAEVKLIGEVAKGRLLMSQTGIPPEKTTTGTLCGAAPSLTKLDQQGNGDPTMGFPNWTMPKKKSKRSKRKVSGLRILRLFSAQ